MAVTVPLIASSAMAADPTTIDLWFHGGVGIESDTFKTQVDDFNASQSAIKVDLTEIPGGAVSAAEDGRHPTTSPVEGRPADGIDAASDRMEAARPAAVLDRARAEADRQQLPPRHDPLLAPCQSPGLCRSRIGH